MNIKKPVGQPAGSARHAADHLVSYLTLIHIIVMTRMFEPPYGWLAMLDSSLTLNPTSNNHQAALINDLVILKIPYKSCGVPSNNQLIF